MGPGMGRERVHQRCQWHLRRGKGRFSGLQGLQRGFPLHLLTLMLWVLARFDRSPVSPRRRSAAGTRGVGGCPGHKSPREAGSWPVAGRGAVLGGCSRRLAVVLASSGRGLSSSPGLPCSPLRSRPAALTAAALPGEGTEAMRPRLCRAKLLGLGVKRLDGRVTLGTLLELGLSV